MSKLNEHDEFECTCKDLRVNKKNTSDHSCDLYIYADAGFDYPQYLIACYCKRSE